MVPKTTADKFQENSRYDQKSERIGRLPHTTSASGRHRNGRFSRISDRRVSRREQMQPKTKIGETNNIGLCLHDLVRGTAAGCVDRDGSSGITAIAKTNNRRFPINA